MTVRAASFSLLLLAATGWTQERTADPTQLVKTFSARCAAARDYGIEGEMRMEASESPTWLRLKFALAVSISGKYALKLGRPSVGFRPTNAGPPPDFGDAAPAERRQAYWRISDGQKLWLYEPDLKRYAECPADHRNEKFEREWALTRQPDPAIRLFGYAGFASHGNFVPEDGDPAELLLRLLLPVLGGLSGNVEQIQFLGGSSKVRRGAGPRVEVVSKGNALGDYYRALLAFDSAGVALRRLNLDYLHVPQRKPFSHLTVNFTRFSVGDLQPDAAFNFVLPREARIALVPWDRALPNLGRAVFIQHP